MTSRSPKTLWGLRQSRKATHLNELRNQAIAKFPDLEPLDALLKYVIEYRVQGIFFQDKEGKRCRWGPDICFYNGKGPHQLGVRLYHIEDDHKRTYRVPVKPLGRWFADRRGNRKAARLLEHYSEPEWAVDKDDDHHLLKFPIEVQLSILDFVIAVPGTVSPKVVTSNWYRHWQMPDLDIFIEYNVPIKKHDAEGPYFVMRKVTRRAIDATILRSCRHFHNLGTNILYGKNNFGFEMIKPTLNGCPPSKIFNTKKHRLGRPGKPRGDEVYAFLEEYYSFFRPNPRKPRIDDPKYSSIIQAALAQIESRVPLPILHGFAIYDPLLRFLYTIGPSSSAKIRKLELSGTIKLHDCSENNVGCKCCRDDLVASLRLYIPFMERFMSSLKTLTLRYNRDPYGPHPPFHIEYPGNRADPTIDALCSLLEHDLPAVGSLTSLEIIGEDIARENNSITRKRIKAAAPVFTTVNFESLPEMSWE